VVSILSDLSSKTSAATSISFSPAFVFSGLAFVFSRQASVASLQHIVTYRQVSALFLVYINAEGKTAYLDFQVGHYFFFQVFLARSHFLWAGAHLGFQSERQIYFTSGGFPPISSSWRQAA
jgi:hypothetical protein